MDYLQGAPSSSSSSSQNYEYLPKTFHKLSPIGVTTHVGFSFCLGFLTLQKLGLLQPQLFGVDADPQNILPRGIIFRSVWPKDPSPILYNKVSSATLAIPAAELEAAFPQLGPLVDRLRRECVDKDQRDKFYIGFFREGDHYAVITHERINANENDMMALRPEDQRAVCDAVFPFFDRVSQSHVGVVEAAVLGDGATKMLEYSLIPPEQKPIVAIELESEDPQAKANAAQFFLLLEAIRNESFAEMQIILSVSPHLINSHDGKECPLMVAIESGNTLATNFLLTYGAHTQMQSEQMGFYFDAAQTASNPNIPNIEQIQTTLAEYGSLTPQDFPRSSEEKDPKKPKNSASPVFSEELQHPVGLSKFK
jgi:hypothetical protein